MPFRLTTTAFTQGGAIPAEHTCEGADRSPPLAWSGAPPGTKSYCVIVDDPDAPSGTFTHWVAYDIPHDKAGLAADVAKGPSLVDGTRQGRNDFGRTGYGGPCPPRGHGRHRYNFKLYAVDVDTLGLRAGATRGAAEAAMSGHVLAEASCMGVYERR